MSERRLPVAMDRVRVIQNSQVSCQRSNNGRKENSGQLKQAREPEGSTSTLFVRRFHLDLKSFCKGSRKTYYYCTPNSIYLQKGEELDSNDPLRAAATEADATGEAGDSPAKPLKKNRKVRLTPRLKVIEDALGEVHGSTCNCCVSTHP